MESVKLVEEIRNVDERQKLDEEIRDRLSTELIIALIGPVASGVTTTARLLKQKLESEFGYDVPDVIKLSDFIKRHAASTINDASLADRITSYQDAGNKLRKDNGHDFLAKLAISRISEIRHSDGFRKVKGDSGDEKDVPLPKRRVHIIDSLKHPEEIAQLREVYGNILWVIGVSAADHMRHTRLEHMGMPSGKIPDILNRDMGEKAEFGQKVRKAFCSADFFIRNDTENYDNIDESLLRFLDVLFGTRLHNPTSEESAMFHAATAASKSACMSRQVGAALVDGSGDLISVGWNDVPKFGGGLYGEGKPDNRCFSWRDRICHNDDEKWKIENRVVEGIRSAIAKKAAEAPLIEGKKQVPVQLTDEEIRGAIDSSGISALIEFSRAIHAEMAAILAVARDKRHSLDGATMVVTTYPCHNCARHIVAAGVRSVVYIEPYEKSLAVKLHPDAITEDDRVSEKVVFRQFQGFAPRHILDLFAMKTDRKRQGRLIEFERKAAVPIYRRHLDSFTLYEDKIVHDVAAFVRGGVK
jgi:deoxycytidylate deaminase